MKNSCKCFHKKDINSQFKKNIRQIILVHLILKKIEKKNKEERKITETYNKE